MAFDTRRRCSCARSRQSRWTCEARQGATFGQLSTTYLRSTFTGLLEALRARRWTDEYLRSLGILLMALAGAAAATALIRWAWPALPPPRAARGRDPHLTPPVEILTKAPDLPPGDRVTDGWMSVVSHRAEYPHEGQVRPADTVARVMLRPIGSALPLGAFALVPSGLLLAGTQLGWFSTADQKMIPFLLLGLAVPVMLIASIFAFLGRDALVGTSFGIFAGTWLAYSLALLSASPGQVSHALGVFFLAIGAIFVMLTGGGLAGGKAAAGGIILAASARFLLTGLYELTNVTGIEHAAGIVGLVFVGVAAYVGFATLLEDSARRSVLPIGRRGDARAAFASGVNAQLDQLEHEAGVRQQL